MSDSVKILKEEKELYLQKILDIEEANQSRPDDIVKMYEKTINVYSDFCKALDEALLALEQKEKLLKQIKRDLKKLDKGCGGFEEYWGHKCSIWITNTSGKNVHIFCNSCKAKIEQLNKISGFLESEKQ